MHNPELVKMSTLIKDISMGPFGSDVKVEYMVDHGVPMLNGSNLIDPRMNGNSFNYVTREKADSLKKALAHPGDVVITHRGTLGQISYVPDDLGYDEFLISQSQFRVTFDTDKVNPIYLTYYFHTSEGQKRLLSFANYVGVPALASATTNFKELEFPLISLEKQNRIVDTLLCLDTKIKNNNAISAALESLAKTIYDYWFVQFDYPDENGKPYKSSGGKMVWNEELKREIPEGWEVKRLGLICKNITDGVHESVPTATYSQYKLLSCQNIKNGILDKDNNYRYIDETIFSKIRSRTQLEKGDVLVSSVGTIGETCLMHDNPDDIEFQRSVAILKPDTQLISPEWLYETIVSYKSILQKKSHGAVQKCIFISDLYEMAIVLPSKDTVSHFTNLVSSILSASHEYMIENQKLASLRDFLLPMLMNGQVKVVS